MVESGEKKKVQKRGLSIEEKREIYLKLMTDWHQSQAKSILKLLQVFRPYCPKGYERSWHEQIRGLLFWLAYHFGCAAIPEYQVAFLDRPVSRTGRAETGRIDLVWVDGTIVAGAFEIDPEIKWKSIEKLKKIDAVTKFVIAGGSSISKSYRERVETAWEHGISHVRVRPTTEFAFYADSIKDVYRLIHELRIAYYVPAKHHFEVRRPMYFSKVSDFFER